MIRPALLYARMGWRVVPLHAVREDGACTCGRPECHTGNPKSSAGKHPRLADWTSQATDDSETIQGWRWPAWNIGIATGAGSGFVVLDVDGDEGRASLAALESEHGPLPATTQAETGRGGIHYLFEHPGFHVSNSAKKLAPGLDVRGDGGQIVAPPSRTVGAYRWVVPPWQTAPAPLPEWLLEQLRRVTPAPAAALPSRGYFPPATAAVLAAAREALAAHGPAVEGQGGDAHTFTACALLVHDFALTQDEALPLLAEWNTTCQPPWAEDDLRAKLRGGERYGTAPYGCKRPQDLLEAVRRAAAEHQGDPMAILGVVRPWMASCRDSALRALVATELHAATGVGLRNLGLPEPLPEPVVLQRGQIQVTVRTAELADEALKAIAPHVYSRSGVLCEVVPGARAWINELEVAGILDLMSRHVEWVRSDRERGAVTTAAPLAVAQLLHARRTHPGVRELDAVTGTPVFLADGTILQARGYSEAARLYLEPTVEVQVPEFPDLGDARTAVAAFAHLFREFLFRSAADFSSALAGILSPLVKHAIRNEPTPLLVISAADAGAGKSCLCKMIGGVVAGRDPDVRPYTPRSDEAWTKLITACVRSGAPINVFDNVNGPFGDSTLDRLLTSSSWSDRVLGVSEAPAVPHVGTWILTGNNAEPIGDTVRRVMLCRLEVLAENPQEREFETAEPELYALEHRAELLGAALTLLRAYHVAGRPNVGLAPWGSFTAWSALVRGALVWAGCADPYLTQRRAQAELTEPEHDAHDFWLEAVRASDGTPVGVALVANQRGAQGVLGLRQEVTVHSLRGLVARFVDRPRLGQRIRRAGGTYRVERI